MLNAHELYLLAETPNPRSASASKIKRGPRYRARAVEQRGDQQPGVDRLSVDHVAVLGED